MYNTALSLNRKKFIGYFFKSIHGLRYAMLKYTSLSMDEIPESSDIDLLIDEQELNPILNIISAGTNVLKIDLHKKSFVTYVSIFFEDCGYLEIDLIHRFDRKGLIYLESKLMLEHAELNYEGIKVASKQHHFEYVMLFYMMNKAEVPFKYQNHFTAFSTEKRAAIFSYLLEKYRLHINTLDDLYDPHKRHRKKILNKIKTCPENTKLNSFTNKLRYWKDVIIDIRRKRGYAVSFSGVDGAGKSTVLLNINNSLRSKYRQQTIVLRHRPSLLPILSSFRYGKQQAQDRAKTTLPRKGKNKNSVSSLLRFSYYFLDYLIGQGFVYYKYILRGYIVLYDRYYFDFIADSKRSNIVLNKNFVKLLYRFVYKPQINIFLCAPPETILQRKQELNANDIQVLTHEYKLLFDEFAQRYKNQQYITISNVDLNKTIDTVIKECISVTN